MVKITITLDEIYQTSKMALEKHGALRSIAHDVAHAIQIAEAKGNVICGLYYLESYCQQLMSGKVKGDVTPEATQVKSGAVFVDAKFGFAQSAFKVGLDMALNAAKENGVASLAVGHAHTCTSLGYFTEQIAMKGYIGIGFTNASAIVSPPNGYKRVLGTNPIAMSVPAKEGGVAFQFDQSTSAVALGKITMANAAGEKIPFGWAVDENGNATDDPAAALKGSLLSMAGYKGWGLGLMVEVMASAFTGSIPSRDLVGLKLPEGAPHNLGQTYLIIDPTLHAGEAFWDNIQGLAKIVDSQENARLPGSRFVMPESVEIGVDIWEKTKSLAV